MLNVLTTIKFLNNFLKDSWESSEKKSSLYVLLNICVLTYILIFPHLKFKIKLKANSSCPPKNWHIFFFFFLIPPHASKAEDSHNTIFPPLLFLPFRIHFVSSLSRFYLQQVNFRHFQAFFFPYWLLVKDTPSFTPGVSKLLPTGQIRPSACFCK